MRAVMLEVPQALLDERRAKGADRWDEVWEGELHMVPAPSDRHREVAGRLFRVPPNDETYTKLDWYASIGVGEVVVVEPETRRVELFANRDGRMVPVEPVVIQALGVRAETVDGTLHLTWEGGSAEI